MKLQFKQEFIDKYSKLTEAFCEKPSGKKLNFEEYEKYLNEFLRQSIRINTLKISVKEFKERFNWDLEQISWCKEGFYLKDKIVIGNTYEHQLGYVYAQSAASMIPVEILEPTKKDFVLDMCAAPGSKTTQIAAIMNNSGAIIANDSKYNRMSMLKANLERCGVMNAIVTLENGRHIKGEYDKILIDAPCSGYGTIRGFTQRSVKTIKSYSKHLVKVLSDTQKKLLLHGFDILKENGVLVYSTCSLEPEEDEQVIKYLLEKRNAKLIKISGFKNGINSEDKEIQKCLKIWPQFYDTDGFFIAKIKK